MSRGCRLSVAMRTDTEQMDVGLRSLDRRVVLAAEIGLAALLGFLALGTRSFWLDESVSVTLAKLDWSSFAHQLRVREGNMSLYHLLLFGWIRMGDSEFAVRSLSVLAGVATVPFGYLVAKRLAGVLAALLAGLLLAVDPMLQRYAQEARGYALCLLLVTAGSYLFVRGLEQPTWTNWVGYAVVMALAAYAHDFALLVPPAHALSLLFRERNELPWRKLAGSAGLLGVLLGLLLYLLASNDSSGIEWATGNGLGRIFTRIHDRTALAAVLLVGGLVLVSLGWVVLRRLLGPRLRSRETWIWAFMLTWMLVPLALVAVLAVVYRPLFVIRYFIICLPPVVLLVSVAVARLPRPRVAAIAAAVLVAASAGGVAHWYANGQDEDWRHATRYVVRSAQPGDGVLFYAPYVRIPFTVYLDQAGGPGVAPQPVYPPEGWETPAIRFNSYVPISAPRVSSAAAPFPHVWVVLSHVGLFGQADTGYAAVQAGLASAGFHEAASRRFTGIEIRRYDKS